MKIVLLDLCVISKLKDYFIKKNELDHDLQEYVKDKDIKFSLFLAIIERMSNIDTNEEAERIKEHLVSDLDFLTKVIGKNRFVESVDFLKKNIGIFYPSISEQDGNKRLEESYLPNIELLKYINKKCGKGRPPKADSFKLFEEIINKSDGLGISRKDTTILIITSLIYGNDDASKLLKLKLNEKDFNPHNALGDIKMLTRFSLCKGMIHKYTPEADVILCTKDKALLNMRNHIKIDFENISQSISSAQFRIKVLDKVSLFPFLFKQKKCINKEELDYISKVLSL
ncbi:hypothetical protein [Acinetobacter pollinis]|uniref:DUF4935 domain-containing protein n=1 Tax=Acinetobacter pollinis TaxID=2605270 RepID=A0ABU6DTT4_9GAMM|nr:hypothetical protein [Acinetobacter pollinis]MEB5477266.1 hypothetical protein [Acinetobacter pollinis]